MGQVNFMKIEHECEFTCHLYWNVTPWVTIHRPAMYINWIYETWLNICFWKIEPQTVLFSFRSVKTFTNRKPCTHGHCWRLERFFNLVSAQLICFWFFLTQIYKRIWWHLLRVVFSGSTNFWTYTYFSRQSLNRHFFEHTIFQSTCNWAYII